MASVHQQTSRAPLRRVGILAAGTLALSVLVTGCGPRGLSCESYNEVYQEQLEKWAFYAALVDGIEGAGATRNNREYDSAVTSRDSLWDSAEEVAASAAENGCYVDRPSYD